MYKETDVTLSHTDVTLSHTDLLTHRRNFVAHRRNFVAHRRNFVAHRLINAQLATHTDFLKHRRNFAASQLVNAPTRRPIVWRGFFQGLGRLPHLPVIVQTHFHYRELQGDLPQRTDTRAPQIK